MVINKAFFLGKKDAKPRLLRISLFCDIEKAMVLKHNSKLNSSDVSSVHRNVFITPDLTCKEQEQNKQLGAKLRESNKKRLNLSRPKTEDSGEEAIPTCLTDNNNTLFPTTTHTVTDSSPPRHSDENFNRLLYQEFIINLFIMNSCLVVIKCSEYHG